MFKKFVSGCVAALIFCGFGTVAAQPPEALLMPSAFEPISAIFHKEARVYRENGGGNQYEVDFETMFGSVTAENGLSKTSGQVNHVWVYQDVTMESPWVTRSGYNSEVIASNVGINGVLSIGSGSGPSTIHSKVIGIPTPGSLTYEQARLITSGDSITHYEGSTLSVRVMESVVFRAKGGGCTKVEFRLYNSLTQGWDLIHTSSVDEGFDLTGVAGCDFRFGRYLYPEWVIDLGGGLYGPRLKVMSFFNDQTLTEYVKDLPMWTMNFGGGGGGLGGGPGM